MLLVAICDWTLKSLNKDMRPFLSDLRLYEQKNGMLVEIGEERILAHPFVVEKSYIIDSPSKLLPSEILSEGSDRGLRYW